MSTNSLGTTKLTRFTNKTFLSVLSKTSNFLDHYISLEKLSQGRLGLDLPELGQLGRAPNVLGIAKIYVTFQKLFLELVRKKLLGWLANALYRINHER